MFTVLKTGSGGFIIVVIIKVCVTLCMPDTYMPEESFRSPKTGVNRGCKLPCSAGNQTQVPWKKQLVL